MGIPTSDKERGSCNYSFYHCKLYILKICRALCKGTNKLYLNSEPNIQNE